MSDFKRVNEMQEEILREIEKSIPAEEFQGLSAAEWTGKPEVRELGDVEKEMAEMFRFIRKNKMIRLFAEDGRRKGPLTDLLNFADENFSSDEMEKWLNVYETENPLLAILKRKNLKGITLAKFLKEIEIWERDAQENPVKDADGKQKKRNLSSEVKIHVRIKSNQPIIELENGTWKAILSSSQEKEDKKKSYFIKILKPCRAGLSNTPVHLFG